MKKNYHKKFKDVIFLDNDRKVKISNESISKIYRYRQTSLKSSEAGGVILGREDISTNNLIIDVVTQPYSKDKRSRYTFLRIDEEHIKIYNKLNQDNKNIYMYIGEWHSHPEYFPNYSAIDYSNWVRICEENDKNSFQYHIIVGIEYIIIWKISKPSNSIIIVYENAWKNLVLEIEND